MLEQVIPEMAKGSATACTAHLYTGQSHTKLRVHREAAPHYEAIVADCSDPVLVSKALYHLGKGMWTVDEDAKAIAAFEKVWTRFPASNLADDAMNYAAQVLDGQGKKAEAQAMFQRQLESYPKGDMVPDALWAMMFERYAARDYRGAVALADRVSGTSGEDDIYTRGRIAYFRARSLEEMRQPSDAKSAYTAVVRNHPMGFYTLLSLNRLAAMDKEGTRSLVAELKRPTEKTEGFIEMVPEVAENRHFVAGVLLLRLSLFKLAAQEFGALRAEFPNRDEVGWLVAKLFDRSGNYQRSHAVPGPRLDMHLAYPAGSNVERWKIAFPQPYLDEVTKRARERGLNPAIIYAIMREESGFNAGIESYANAYGLLQLMLPTANDMAKKTGRGTVAPRDLFQPAVNIELGTMFMKVLSESYDGHAALIIGGYNGGRGNIDKWLKDRGRMPLDLWVEEIPFAQTREYVKRVTTSYWVYHWLYGSGEGWVDLPFDIAPLSPR
jgi:soluble lytic murein transglycosylase